MIENLRCIGACGGVIVPSKYVFAWESGGWERARAKLTVIGAGRKKVFESKEATNRILADLSDLKPEEKYRCFVGICGERGAERSEETVLYVTDENFYGAKWISDGRSYIDPETKLGSPSVTLRKIFHLRDRKGVHILKICGLGFFTAFLNGQRIGDGVLEPPFTVYDKRVIFRAYEVSEFLTKGENVLEVYLGDGWYNQTTADTWGFCHASWRDGAKMIACLTGEGGFVSDSDWEYSYNRVVSNALRAGEKTDCNVHHVYRPALVVPPAGGELVFDKMPPIRECEKVAPVSRREKEGYILFDFGKSMSGYMSFFVRGKKGTKVSVVYSDRLTDGKPDNASNGMYIFNEGVRFQTDEIVLSGGEDFYKPAYTYHGYRYAGVEYSGEISLSEPVGYFVHTDLERIGQFECSHPLLNKLYAMTVQAILSNYVGFPTDCPHREKNGWTGDAQLSLEMCVHTFDMSESYIKYLKDIADCQRPCGQIPAIAPTSGWGYNWGSGPAWDVAFFRLAYAEYYYYGRTDVPEAHYENLKKYLGYLSTYEDERGLVDNGLGDWNYPKKISFGVCPVRLTSSCYYMQMLNIFAEISDVLGREEGESYRGKADRLKGEILSAYREETSLTGMASLTYFGILDKTEEICAYLKECEYAPHVGILGNKFLVESLGRAGKIDELYRYLIRTDYPSFGHWAKMGQTALCEDFELTNSLNHHMYSPVAEALVKYMAGIRAGKNLTEFSIAPRLPEGEKYASASIITPCGKLSVRAERTAEGIALETEVPFGVKAVLAFTGESLPFGRSKNLLKVSATADIYNKSGL